MKVLMLNGSPRKEGCTYTALIQIAGVLEKNGIESEIFQAGTPELENVRAAAEKMKEADALIVGSPVYWASPSGQIIEFMDKFCSLAGKDMLLKPAAAIASARRAGTTATLDVHPFRSTADCLQHSFRMFQVLKCSSNKPDLPVLLFRN